MKHENDPPPLSDLRDFVSEDTFEWLEDAEEKERSWIKIQKAMQKFQTQAASSEKSSSKPTNNATIQERIQEWTSSRSNPDGCGGFEIRNAGPMTTMTPRSALTESGESAAAAEEATKRNDADDDGERDNVTVKYVLSGDVWQGFGNQVWAASRHLANMLADPAKCQLLLDPFLSTLDDEKNKKRHHPLGGIHLCELGTGAGIPGWTAMRRGARVVALDQAIPGRIRAVAECAQRNWQATKEDTTDNENTSSLHQPIVFPYDWGSSVEDIMMHLKKDGQDRFDVLVAADCLFMPWFHSELLESIDLLLSDCGVAILTFPLHGNVPEGQIWGFVDMANESGFATDQPFPSLQLTPQTTDMHLRQALIYTLRLRRQGGT